MYVKVVDGQASRYTIAELKAANPNVSFPKNISDEILANYNVFPAIEAECPTYDPAEQKAIKNQEPTLVNGAWIYGWTIEPVVGQERVEVWKKKQASVRSKRDAMLSDCDWTQLADAPVNKEAWATYRQALRDITTQEGFPFNVVFPEQP
jgi:hypothetical protein